MPFSIVTKSEGWVLNDQGDVLIVDSDSGQNLWIPSNTVLFNEQNKPFLQVQSAESSNLVETVPLGYIRQANAENSESEYQAVDDVQTQNDDVQTQNDTSGSLTRHTWPYNHTLALIDAVQAHYEDMHDIKKRKSFWIVVSEELNSQGLQFSDIACKKKWDNLIRTYKSVKDIKRKSGRGATRFLFYDKLDELLGDHPTNASPHSIDVGIIDTAQNKPSTVPTTSVECCTSGDDEPVIKKGSSKKRANPSTEYIRFKKRYYEQKEKQSIEKQNEAKKQFNEYLAIQRERIEVLKEKNRIELRKVEVLEKLASQ